MKCYIPWYNVAYYYYYYIVYKHKGYVKRPS